MPGYQLPKQIIVLDFKGTDWEGAEVKLRRSISLDTYLFYQALDTTKMDEDAQLLKGALIRFGDELLDSWNLHDDNGDPIPADGDHLIALGDTRFSLTLLLEWRNATEARAKEEGASPGDGSPLAMPSQNGRQSEAQPATTGRSSQSQRRSKPRS